MVHKMIKKTTEEWIEPKDEKEVDKLLSKAQEEKKKETDVVDDYSESLEQFLT
mgnify:CR=1 FL=1